jgi:hypothetical protein
MYQGSQSGGSRYAVPGVFVCGVTAAVGVPLSLAGLPWGWGWGLT